MKKILTLALTLALTVGLAQPARGAGEEIIGHALYTEVVAEIDGAPIASYNVAGRTAVMVQDLAQYGFYIYWNEEAKAAYVWPESIRPGGAMEGEPDFVPQPPEGKVGDPAYPIYASDVKVYVAGEEKESFNIGGHVMVYLSDLTAYGDVTWNAEEKVAALQVAEDPVKLAMDRLEENVYSPEHAALYNGTITYYEGGHGTLAVVLEGGTMHGNSCSMLYVDRSGKQTWIERQLPYYPFGQEFYLEPTEIAFDQSGDQLTFITPVKEIYEDMSENIWGLTRCTFDTASGKIVSMEPLSHPLEQWDAVCDPYQGMATAPGKPLRIEVGINIERYDSQFEKVETPWNDMRVTIDNQGVTIAHYGGDVEDAAAPYSKAYRALAEMGLPDVTKDGFVQENTPEQRAQAGQYFRVTKNGQSVPGVLWWSQGNGHRDLKFTFDQNVSLAREDVVCLWVGVPGEN